MIFKKKLCITRSIRAQAEIRAILSRNHIRYELKTIDRNKYNETYRIVSNPVNDLIYEFFVAKKDIETARYLIQEVRLQD